MNQLRLLRAVLLIAVAALMLLLAPDRAHAEAKSQRVGVAGYFRIMARPDFQGGVGTLGYWNLYGRLLNEGPWAALELRINLLESPPGSSEPWTSLHFKIEGGAAANAEGSGGMLGQYRLSQLYVDAGNVLIPGVVWRLGTLDTWLGDLGLYDMKPAQLFYEALGLSARWNKGPIELVLGVGDSGFYMRGFEYSTVLTGGGYARVRAGKHFEVALGGQVMYEPKVEGNRHAPYLTPGMDYEDWLRGEVVESFLDDNPGQADDFPRPEATSSVSGKAIGYLGVGNLGPLRWNSFYVSFTHLHPDNFTTEEFEGTEYTLYVNEFTDQRYALLLGNEARFEVVPNRLDIAWALVYGDHWDGDNEIAPSNHDRWYFSTVLRAQVYLSRTFHLLFEGSFAQEVSRNGNTWRDHADSIFRSTDGRTDSEGLEYGDADERFTGQLKGGIVLNPLGPGIYTRPSLRLLYGAQYSTQNYAYGNSFAESLSQHNEFGAFESHWHHVIAIEAEAWF